MRLIHIPIAAAAFYLGLSISIAPAQQNQLSDPGQQQRHDNMIQTKPGQGGKEEPSSHAPTASETDIFVNGKLVVPGAPAESQTEPAKFSERNARIDAMPIMAYPLGLSDEQKQRIVESIAKRQAGGRSSRRHARGGVAGGRESGRADDQRPALHPHPRQDPAGACHEHGGDRRDRRVLTFLPLVRTRLRTARGTRYVHRGRANRCSALFSPRCC
jgi:hypothetical protein